MKIGVFDSGVGGITVLTELQKELHGADFVYYGDNLNLPYGTKSSAQVARLSADCAHALKARDVDAVVVACNTASSLALDAVREVMGEIPVFGVVEPGAAAVTKALRDLGRSDAPVLILATRATVKSGAYGKTLGQQRLRVFEQPCPLLVPIIEEGWGDHEVLHLALQEYVRPYQKLAVPGAALLACTHYPWIHSAFERALPGWTVVNSAQAITSALVQSDFWVKSLATRSATSPVINGTVDWVFTDPDTIPAFALSLIRQ